MDKLQMAAIALSLAACTPAPPAPAPAADNATAATPAPASAAPAGAGGGASREAASGTTPGADSAAAGLARLTGRLAYPSEELPAMRVCALAADDPGTAVCADTAANAPHYALDVPAGDWWLLAWPRDTGTAGDPGLLSAASECLGSGGLGCDDHALLAVTAAPGEVREGLDINDWYYDPREFPPPMPPRGADDAP